MERLPFEEPMDAWCPFCPSHGAPAGEEHCPQCRPVRSRYLEELPRRSLSYRLRRAVHRATGIDPGRGILTAASLGALLAAGLLLAALGG